MSKLKEEIISEVKKRFIWFVYPTEISAPGSKPTAYFNKDVEPEELIDFLSSKIDEIEKEVMGLLPEENIKPPRTFTEKGYNSAIQTIREKITKYFL